MGAQDAVEMSCTVPGVRHMPRSQHHTVIHRDPYNQQCRLGYCVSVFLQISKSILVPPEAVLAFRNKFVQIDDLFGFYFLKG